MSAGRFGFAVLREIVLELCHCSDWAGALTCLQLEMFDACCLWSAGPCSMIGLQLPPRIHFRLVPQYPPKAPIAVALEVDNDYKYETPQFRISLCVLFSACIGLCMARSHRQSARPPRPIQSL